MSAAPWHCDPDAPIGKRIVQIAISVLTDGALSQAKRTGVYRAFIACGGKEQLEKVKTSCAVFAGAVLHWAGRRAKLPRYPASGATSITSWLNGLTQKSKAWRAYDDDECIPCEGAIFYVEADSNPGNNHVGVLCVEIAEGLWLCAEGGGGDGTECKFTVRKWGPKWDARRLRGLWIPDGFDGKPLLDGVGDPPDPDELPAPAFPLGPGSSREDVQRWQDRLVAVMGPKILPVYGADGGWGNETFRATCTVQKLAGLPETGRVDVATWEACAP